MNDPDKSINCLFLMNFWGGIYGKEKNNRLNVGEVK